MRSSDRDINEPPAQCQQESLALGLSRLELDAHPPHPGSTGYRPGSIVGRYFYLADKPFGVEPGFLAVEMDQNFLQHVNAILGEEYQDIIDFEFDLVEKSISILVETLILEGNRKILPPKGLQPISLLLFKQDYEAIDSLGNVAPPIDRLAQTSWVKNYPEFAQTTAATLFQYARSNTPINESKNGIRECLGNNYAHLYGAQVQKQDLVLGTYPDGTPKIMTVCVWDPEFKTLEGLLGGGRAKEYDHYLIPEVRTKELMADIGSFLILAIVQSDNDVIGSKGGNKGLKNNRLFGFDFGHAFRGENILLTDACHLQDDFSFTQPRQKFKNISLFYDTTITERMAGMFYLYRMTDQTILDECLSKEEQAMIEKVIELYIVYQPGFKQRFLQTQPESLLALFDAYYLKFIQLAMNENDQRKSKILMQYADEIEKIRKNTVHTHIEMFKRFKHRMQISPTELDLLQHIEMFTSATTLFSPNEKIPLRHLRILPNKKMIWNIETDSEGRKIFVGKLEKYNFKLLLQNYTNLGFYFKHELAHHDIWLTHNKEQKTIKIALPLDPHEQQLVILKLADMFAEEKIIKIKLFSQKEKINDTNAGFYQLLYFSKESLVSNIHGDESLAIKKQGVSKITDTDHDDQPLATNKQGVSKMTDTQVIKMITPLLIFLNPKDSPTVFKRALDAQIGHEKREERIHLVKECIANILNSNRSAEEILTCLENVARKNTSLQKGMSKNLQKILGFLIQEAQRLIANQIQFRI